MNFSTRAGLLILFVNTGALSGTAQAQRLPPRVSLPGESRATADRLAAVGKLAEGKQWPEAVEEYLHILEEAGDDLVPLDRFHRVAARRLCHLRLAELPAPILRLYRERVDPQAQQWLEQGKAERDPRLLRRLVDEAFCSRFTDQAIDLLGDMAFERGHFEEALAWWDLLAPHAPGEPGASATGVPPRSAPEDQEKTFHLVYPNPQVDLTRVRAKQILARLFQGERAGLPDSLKSFGAKYGKVEGALAGRKGKYADILKALAKDPELTTEVERRKNESQPWPTFAGDPSRNFIPTAAPSRLTLETPPWPVRLDGQPADKNDFLAARRLLPPSPAPRGAGLGLGLNFYPVIAGDLVLVADARSVTAYDLITGRQKGKYDLLEDLKGPPLAQLDLSIGAKSDVGFTVTASDNRVYARLGTVRLLEITPSEKKSGNQDSYLVCLDLPPRNGKFIPRWFHSSNNLDKESQRGGALFEGAPVVHDGLAYIARTRVEKTDSTTEIDCVDAKTGKLRWRQDVCIVQEGDSGEPRQRHHLLTLAGGNVVYCCQSGALIALDAGTGKRVWAVRYPSRGLIAETGTPSPRDLTPCVYASGRLFVAPADFAGILCVDADTGQKIWENQQIEVVHLLGVAKGRLIFTTGRKPRGIQGLDAATGKESRKWFQPEGEGELPSFGRGFLAGDYVFWPTQPNPYLGRLPSLRILNQEDGQLPADVDPEQYWQIQPGNMAFGNGCLAVADQERLYVYVPPCRLLEERRKDAVLQPDSAPAHYRLAVAEADAGLAVQARDDFARAERLAKPEEHWEGFPLRKLARTERHRLLLALAQREWRQNRPQLANSYLEEASAPEFSNSERLQTFRRKAEWLGESQRPEQAVVVWQAVLDDEALRAGQMLDGHGSPQQAVCYAAEQISGLINAYGASVYQAVEERALAELNSVPKNRRSEGLIRLGRQFPNASIIRSALLQDAAAQEEAGRPAIAAQEYRSLLVLTENDQARTPALEGLARIYQDQRQQEAARSTPELKLPQVPRWQVSLSAPEHLVGPVSPQATNLFFVAGTQLTCRGFFQNDPCWKRTLPDCPCWVGTHADLVIVAGTHSIHCLHKADGREFWRFADPALPTLVLSNDSDRGNECLFSQFHFTGGLLVFLQGDRRLFAIDVETGRVLWTRWAPGAQIRPSPPSGEFVRHFHADANRVVVQTSAGRCLMLDSLTGRVVAEISSAGELWPQPPLVVGDRQICTVAGSRQISSLDLPTGRELWRIRAPLPGITTQPPQLLGDGNTLLCLVDAWQLFRLDPSNGQTLWKRGTGTEPLSMDHIAFDQEGAYYVSRNVLHARSLADGRPLWSLDLPNLSVPWTAVAASDYLLVFPSQAPHQLRWGIFLGSHPMSFPIELRWDKFPVLICDRKEGKVVQRMVFPGEGSEAAVHCFGKGLAVVVGNEIHTYFGQETAKENARSGAEGAQPAPK